MAVRPLPHSWQNLAPGLLTVKHRGQLVPIGVALRPRPVGGGLYLL